MGIFNGRTHVGISALIMYWIATQVTPINIWFIIGGVIGSLLPDSDHAHAPAGRILWLHKFYGHRKQVHSIFFLIIFAGIGAIINISFGLGIALGFGLHLIGDSLTPSGIYYWFWYPYKKIKA